MSISSGKYSLRFSLGSAFVGIVVLTSFSLGLATYLIARSFVRDDIRLRLHDLAGVTALHIDGDEHGRIQGRDDEQTDPYRRIRAYLRQVRDSAQGIRFIYTMRKDAAGKLVFVVDAEENPQEVSHVGDVYEQVTPLMQATFGNPPTAHVESEFNSDKWGTWLSGYAPIRARNGDVVGIVGMDMSAQQVLSAPGRNYGDVFSHHAARGSTQDRCSNRSRSAVRSYRVNRHSNGWAIAS